jgi:hypothetical protein
MNSLFCQGLRSAMIWIRLVVGHFDLCLCIRSCLRPYHLMEPWSDEIEHPGTINEYLIFLPNCILGWIEYELFGEIQIAQIVLKA